jgi:hypothetical protein
VAELAVGSQVRLSVAVAVALQADFSQAGLLR